jgi:hypothetical protein
MKTDKYLLIMTLANRILPAYDETGLTVPEYYNNIILPELTKKEYEILKALAEGNI